MFLTFRVEWVGSTLCYCYFRWRASTAIVVWLASYFALSADSSRWSNSGECVLCRVVLCCVRFAASFRRSASSEIGDESSNQSLNFRPALRLVVPMPRDVDTTDPVVVLHPAALRPIALSAVPARLVPLLVVFSPAETQRETPLSLGKADLASFATLPTDDSDSVDYWTICPYYPPYTRPIALAGYRSLSSDYLLYRAMYKRDETNVSPPTADPCLSPILGLPSHQDFLWVTHRVSERGSRCAPYSNHVAGISPKSS